MSRTKRFRRTAVALGTSLAVGVGLVSTLGPTSGIASSHREAPLIAGDPQLDNTDVYAFVSPDKPNTVTLISNWIPFQEPAGGPNFYTFEPKAHYNIKIDNDHDAKADITLQWVFRTRYRSGDTFLYNNGPVTSLDDENLNVFQTYDLRWIEDGKVRTLVNDAIAAPSRVGEASMPNYGNLRREAITKLPGGGKSFAGQAEDPFFLDLRVFDLLYGGDLSEVGDDTLAGFNVNTIAAQIPMDMLAKGKNAKKNPIIGIWSTGDRRRATIKGNNTLVQYRQVSRLGMPLVNEVVIPLRDKDEWNRSRPKNDGQFLDYVTKPELPKLLDAIYGIPAPEEPRNDLVAVFLTGVEGLNQPKGGTPSEMLRLNMSIPPCEPKECDDFSRLGVIKGDVAGFPNGRRLADDTVDIALRVVEGILGEHPKVVEKLGDGVRFNDKPFGNRFPYVALPFSGSNAGVHSES